MMIGEVSVSFRISINLCINLSYTNIFYLYISLSIGTERRSNLSRNFVDGDLVERYLELSPEECEVIVKYVNDDINLIALNNTNPNEDMVVNESEMANTNLVTYTADEILRRIEEISRSH